VASAIVSSTAGMVAVVFVHRTSRNGDPQLHTHVLAANAVLGANGRESTPPGVGSRSTAPMPRPQRPMIRGPGYSSATLTDEVYGVCAISNF
jgi:hypothetical protein